MNDHFMIAVIAVVGIVALVGVISLSGENDGIGWPEDNLAGEGSRGGRCIDDCKAHLAKSGRDQKRTLTCASEDMCGNQQELCKDCYGDCIGAFPGSSKECSAFCGGGWATSCKGGRTSGEFR